MPASIRRPGSGVICAGTASRSPLKAYVIFGLTLLLGSCGRDQDPLLSEFDKPKGEALSLRQTFEKLRVDYARRAYVAMRPYIDPEQREGTIDVLLAVDELLAANGAVLKAVRRVSPETPSQALDVSGPVLDNLEIFSREVQIVDEREEGQTGIVRILIAATPPPVEIHFRRLDGHWVYMPGAGIADAVQAFRDLTKALNRIAQTISYGEHLTPQQVAYEFQLRVQPRLQGFRPSAPAN